MLPVVVAQSSDGIAVHYILPVLEMMPCFHSMQPVGRTKHDVLFIFIHRTGSQSKQLQ